MRNMRNRFRPMSSRALAKDPGKYMDSSVVAKAPTQNDKIILLI